MMAENDIDKGKENEHNNICLRQR